MKKIIPLFLATLALSACGKMDLRSEKASGQFVTLSNKLLSAQEFQTACQKKGGIVEENGTLCLYDIKYSALADGGPATSHATADISIAKIESGTAVKALGWASDDSVELVLDSNPLASIPTNRLVTTNGGELAFRLRPGSFSGVKVFVYGCLDQAMEPIRCPY